MSDEHTNKEAVMPLTSLTAQADEAPEAGRGDAVADAGSLLASSESKKRSPAAGMLVIVLVVIVAAAGLYFMRKMGVSGHFAFSSVEIKVPSAVGNTENYDTVMRDISTGTTDKQVPLENVQKNPFYIERTVVVNQPATTTTDREAERERLEQERLEQARLAAVDRAFKSLTLRSIMGGSRPMAVVNDRLRQVGDRVGDHFTIVGIGDRGIDLRTDKGERFRLELSTD